MLNTTLVTFYERDLRKLVDEVKLFKQDEDLWKTQGSVKNSSGNLVLHIIGGSNYLFGTVLAGTGYVRHRDQEFTHKGVPREELVAQLEALITLVTGTLNPLTLQQLEAEYPIMFDDMRVPTSYVMVQLLAHLNYHLGQVNYMRRVMETTT